MDPTDKASDGVFSKLNGAPAQVLIIAGLTLLLAAPLIPSFKSAGVVRAQTAFNQLDAFMELDLDDLKRAQDKERKADQEAAARENTTAIDYSLAPEQIQKLEQQKQSQQAKRQENERNRQQVFDDKREELKKKYDSNVLKRALLEAQAGAAGSRWHLVLLFLGNVMLLVGLLVITLESTGMRQTIALIILLVAMFSALSGVSLTFLTAGSLGDHSPNFERLIKSP